LAKGLVEKVEKTKEADGRWLGRPGHVLGEMMMEMDI
jgi:hypothetical protein